MLFGAITSTKMFGVLLWVRRWRCAESLRILTIDMLLPYILKAEEVVGHVPRELSKIMFKFMDTADI